MLLGMCCVKEGVLVWQGVPCAHGPCGPTGSCAQVFLVLYQHRVPKWWSRAWSQSLSQRSRLLQSHGLWSPSSFCSTHPQAMPLVTAKPEPAAGLLCVAQSGKLRQRGASTTLSSPAPSLPHSPSSSRICWTRTAS